MGQDKVMSLFFEEPNRLYQVREIARITGIPKTTVARKLEALRKRKLIEKRKENVIGYKANESESYYRLMKKLNFLERVYQAGLIECLEEKFHPRCIILFGSFAKGEYHKKSDIDIFVQAKEKGYKLDRFEKKLKHTINLFFEENLNRLSKELFNNVVNGIKLSGYIKLR